MYPYFRIAQSILTTRKDPDFSPETDVLVDFRVRLMDRDIYPELNNGRYYQMADVARIRYAMKSGLLQMTHKRKWSLVAGGSSSQWRRRILFRQRYTLSTRIVYFDRMWFYFLHEFRRGDVKHASILFRGGVTRKEGLVPTHEVLDMIGFGDWEPPQDPWIQSWIDSEKLRPKL